MTTGRVLRGNLRKVVAWVGAPDTYSTNLANTMAIQGTASPASRGAQGLSNCGLPGDWINAYTGDSGPVQHFAGIPRPVADPMNGFGGLTAGHLPNTGGSNSSLAWLSLGQTSPGMGG